MKMRGRRAGSSRGSVLVIVLITLVFAVTALFLFIERASTDLIVHVRDADRINLRQEAYSALETTLAVLVQFDEVLGGLHSPAEGWGDPLAWGDYEPGEGREVSVQLVDESGRVSFSSMDFDRWVRLFESWGVQQTEAERWADALLGWSQEDYTPASFDAPRVEDYEQDPLGFVPPARAPYSWAELRAIDVIRDEFFDEDGQPNDYYRWLGEAVTLFRYGTPNINAATPGAMVALAQYDDYQQELLGDYLGGSGVYRGTGAGYFTDANEVTTVLGDQAGATGFGAEVQALRVLVTVKQGPSTYTLDVVVSPSGGASANTWDPIPEREMEGESGEDDETASSGTELVAAAAWAIAGSDSEDDLPDSIEYPFTLLSIHEMGGASSAAESAVLPDA